MSKTIIYRNHVIHVSETMTEDQHIYHCTAKDEAGETVVDLSYYCNSMPIVDLYENLFEEAKNQIRQTELSVTRLFKTYRKNGLTYISSHKRMGSITFKRGDTLYEFQHTCDEGRYHYVALPNIKINDFVQFEVDGAWWHIRFINQNHNWSEEPVYYAINKDMELKVFSSGGEIYGYKEGSWETNDLDIADKNNKALSIRIPEYIYQILNDEIRYFGMNMNSTIRECIMFAIDQYFTREE